MDGLLEKSVRVFYNVISVIVHVSVLALIFSVPVLFAVKAEAPLDFTLNSMNVMPASSGDGYFAENGIDPAGWYKIDYDMTVKSEKLSPYGYEIEKFALLAPSDIKYGCEYSVALDGPVSFGTAGEDGFILTLYLKTDKAQQDVTELARTLSFGARNSSRTFSVFKTRISVYAPKFSIGEISKAET